MLLLYGINAQVIIILKNLMEKTEAAEVSSKLNI